MSISKGAQSQWHNAQASQEAKHLLKQISSHFKERLPTNKHKITKKNQDGQFTPPQTETNQTGTHSTCMLTDWHKVTMMLLSFQSTMACIVFFLSNIKFIPYENKTWPLTYQSLVHWNRDHYTSGYPAISYLLVCHLQSKFLCYCIWKCMVNMFFWCSFCLLGFSGFRQIIKGCVSEYNRLNSNPGDFETSRCRWEYKDWLQTVCWHGSLCRKSSLSKVCVSTRKLIFYFIAHQL